MMTGVGKTDGYYLAFCRKICYNVAIFLERNNIYETYYCYILSTHYDARFAAQRLRLQQEARY